LQAPEAPLSDGFVTLRLPRPDDVAALIDYVRTPGGLDGGWLPVDSGASPARLGSLVEDWLAGWAGAKSHNGRALLLEIDVDPVSPFVGQVGFGSRAPNVVELVYGIAPARRGQGLATRAARLAAHWLLRGRGAQVVELRIAPGHAASRRVAEKAGFRIAGTVHQHVAATGVTHDDVRYVLR
jgi:RimJ/RimL family protein N-acetyltransferase